MGVPLVEDWLTYSPDLSLIENVRSWGKYHVESDIPGLQLVEDTGVCVRRTAAEVVWDAVPLDWLQQAVRSKPRHLGRGYWVLTSVWWLFTGLCM